MLAIDSLSLAGRFKCGRLVLVMATIPHVPTAIVENGFMPTELLVLMGSSQIFVRKNVILVEGNYHPKFNKGLVSKGYSKKKKQKPNMDITLPLTSPSSK